MTRRIQLRLIALAVTLAIVAVVWSRYLTPDASAGSAQVARLAQLVGTHRLARARLTGGFAYAPCASDSASDSLVHGLACAGPRPESWARSKSFSKFINDLRGPSLDAHTAGVWKLIWDKTEDAVADLREAVKRDSGNALALNDLAVALTRYAQQHDNPSALIDAFVAVDGAVRLDTTLVEAHFTRALVLEKLYLRTDAIEEWNRYLKLDWRSGWADEAREHLKALQPQDDKPKRDEARMRRAVAESDSQTIRSLIAASPSNVRITVHGELAAWGAAFARGDSVGARAHLNFARSIAAPFRAVTGDALLFDAVAAIDRARATSGADTRALADGHVALADGIRYLESDTDATATLRNALHLLSSVKSPMRYWALLYVARAEYGNPEALSYLTAIRDSAPAGHVALRSIAALYQGFLYHIDADYVHALTAYDSALAENRRTADPGVALRGGSWKAQDEDLLRGREAGWRTRYEALAASPRFAESYQALVSMFDYAGRATETDVPRLSLLYRGEAITAARRLSGSPNPYALGRRAELLARVGQASEALAVIKDAFKAVEGERQLSENARKVLRADLMLAEAHIATYSAPAQAAQELRSVIDAYHADKFEKGLPSAYLYLAQSMAASGAIERARDAFDSATTLTQRQRAAIAGYAERGAFLDAARSVIDQTVAFHAQHKSSDAFEFFEGNRSRVLLERLSSRPGFALDKQPLLAALSQRLTKDDVVLSYAVLPNELLIWVVTRDGLQQHRVPVTASDLEELVERFQRTFSAADAQSDDSSASARLHRLLIDSAGPLPPGANLFVIPDRWLHFVPFAALRDPVSGQYLLKNHTVTYAPSAALLLSNLARPARWFSHASKVMTVGNPTFDRRAFSLHTLPAAEREARSIASLYDVHNSLIGAGATDSSFERMAPAFDILHFAGHAIVGRNAAELSHLVLAPQGRSDGAVFSSEIAQWKLPRTRLVVLSGCSTADGRLSATEGASSLARAFFAAGVPAVVSSFWAIEDDDTADFFVKFHTHLVTGVSPAAALRRTQIEFLGDGRSIRSWAAFQLFGG